MFRYARMTQAYRTEAVQVPVSRPYGLSGSGPDAVGQTSLIEVEGVYASPDPLNPSGPAKARAARHLVERAKKEGLPKPGDARSTGERYPDEIFCPGGY